MQHRFRNVVTAVAISLVAFSALPGARVLAQDRYDRDRDRDDRDRDDRSDRGDRGGPGDRVELDSFYEALEPHGRWFQHAQYGYVWSPDVDRNWRPYTRGKWQFTEEHGWYWQAEEPWGWAVFHYGRWFLDDDSGWVWVPGTEWAPAWVAWRHSDETVGWAPLPPEAEWRGSGLAFSESYYDSPRFNVAWSFAPITVLAGYSVYRYLHPASRNYAYVNRTRWVQSHSFVNSRIYNSGFDRSRYQQVTGRQITPLRIVAAQAPIRHGWSGAPRGEVHIYRPNMARTAVTVPPPRVGDQPQRDWRHGRPGVTNQPFQRPSWGGGPMQQQSQQPSQQQQQPAAQPGGFLRQGQRPPIAPTPQAQPQQPAAQQPATQQQAPSWNRQARPPIAPTPQAQSQQAPVQQAPITRSAPAQAPVQQPAAQPTLPPPVQQPAARAPPPAPPPVVRQAPPPQPQAQRPQQQRPQGAGGGGGPPQGAPPPGQGQGKGDGKGDGKDRKKQEPPKQ